MRPAHRVMKWLKKAPTKKSPTLEDLALMLDDPEVVVIVDRAGAMDLEFGNK